MEFDLKDAEMQLGRMPEVLNSLVGQLPAEFQQARDGEETWSAFDVIGHLVHCEKADWMVRARIILEYGEDKQFPPFDRFAQFRESEGKLIGELLGEFALLRKANLDSLRSLGLSSADLDKTGIHPAFGQVSLRQLLATWVAHDYGHLVQIARTLARQYKQAVGPWAQYLSVMGK